MAAALAADLNKLNDHLLTRSYISGWSISSDDVDVFNKISSAPSQQNVLRWWNHIASFKDGFASVPKSDAAPAAAAPAAESEEEDDDDFFGSDSDEEADAAAEALKQKRIDEYNARKAAKEDKKGKVIAKSSITFGVKPWDDETDLDVLCGMIKEIEMDGLLWGTAQKKPLAYGIFKLSITCVVEDDKVGSDDLTEKIEAFEDEVQSVDIAAFQKI